MNDLVNMILAETWQETVVRMLIFVFIIETVGGICSLIGSVTNIK